MLRIFCLILNELRIIIHKGNILMNVTVKRGAVSSVQLVDPPSLQNMDENEIVIINRVQLNTKLVEFEIRNISSLDVITLKEAAHRMKVTERRYRRHILGAEMRVGDIIKIFPEYKTLPKNTFAIWSF